jgi:hypothetical protein
MQRCLTRGSTIVLGFLLGLGACAKSKSETGSAASAQKSASAPSAAEPAPAAPAAHQPPPDVDVAAIEKQLGCSGNKTRQACRVLGEFNKAERWPADPPSGKGRWVGNAFKIEKGAETRSLLILYAERLPTSQVGVSDVPVKIATGPMPDDLQEHGTKLVNILGRGDVPTKKNRAQPFVDTFAPKDDRGATNTSGRSLRLISEQNVFIRKQGTRKLYYVETKAGAQDSPGDGVYAELWLATW